MSAGEHRKELSGGFRRTTNNRMEILAVIKALEALNHPCRVTLHSDSRYVVNSMKKGRVKEWLEDRDDFVNIDLWQKLVALCGIHVVDFQWVRGHAGNPGNERADQLAVEAAQAKELPIDEVYEALNEVFDPSSLYQPQAGSGPIEISNPLVVRVYICGSAIGNPGPGGYGVVVCQGEQNRELEGGYRYTTNNRMDILGAIKALESLEQSSRVEIRNGNGYLVDAISKGWVLNWQKRGWVGEKRKPTPNRDLWERLLSLLTQHMVICHWSPEVKETPEYIRSTRLAESIARRKSLPPDEFYEAETGRTSRSGRPR